MYPPDKPQNGIYRVKILSVDEDENAYTLRFDIAVGVSAGWATYMYQQTGKWLLTWRLDKQRGDYAIKCALSAVNRCPNVQAHTINQLCNHHLCLYLACNPAAPYINVKKSLALSAYKVSPNDIRLDPTVSWAKGSAEYLRASLLASYSGLPVVWIDFREKKSLMIDWCAAHGIILLPSPPPTGDYQLSTGSVLVDRKSNLLELYNDFVVCNNRGRYEHAAVTASAHQKLLTYVVATEPKDAVRDFDSLASWSSPIPTKGKTADGNKLVTQLRRYQMIFPHTSFVFCNQDQLCDTIMLALKRGSMISPHNP